MKPDWNFLEISNKSRHGCSWLKTTFLKSFGRKGDSEMGMELKRKEESKLLGFQGCTTACLKAARTQPDIREE